jgi:hypothetical protein
LLPPHEADGKRLGQFLRIFTDKVAGFYRRRHTERGPPVGETGAGGLLAGVCLTAMANRQGVLLGPHRVQLPFRSAEADVG